MSTPLTKADIIIRIEYKILVLDQDSYIMDRICISLLTDFGLQDGFVGVMKGVIYSIAPNVQVVDITHQIQPQNILQAALILERSYKYFPEGSVHIAVVDPGVGTERAGLAAKTNKHYFVAPDNGILSCVIDYAKIKGDTIEVVKLEESKYWLPNVSRTFHGRDIFAPVAAHLANGIALNILGTNLENPVRIDMPQPSRTKNGWQAQVILCDVFGNLITNLTADHLVGLSILEVRIGTAVIKEIHETFGQAKPGSLVVLLDSNDHLSINLVNGNASNILNAQVGDQVNVILA